MAERVAIGKPECGTIHVAASHESGSVVIRVSDDGRGLDVARIREKVLGLGLSSAARARPDERRRGLPIHLFRRIFHRILGHQCVRSGHGNGHRPPQYRGGGRLGRARDNDGTRHVLLAENSPDARHRASPDRRHRGRAFRDPAEHRDRNRRAGRKLGRPGRPYRRRTAVASAAGHSSGLRSPLDFAPRWCGASAGDTARRGHAGRQLPVRPHRRPRVRHAGDRGQAADLHPGAARPLFGQHDPWRWLGRTDPRCRRVLAASGAAAKPAGKHRGHNARARRLAPRSRAADPVSGRPGRHQGAPAYSAHPHRDDRRRHDRAPRWAARRRLWRVHDAAGFSGRGRSGSGQREMARFW